MAATTQQTVFLFDDAGMIGATHDRNGASAYGRTFLGDAILADGYQMREATAYEAIIERVDGAMWTAPEGNRVTCICTPRGSVLLGLIDSGIVSRKGA